VAGGDVVDVEQDFVAALLVPHLVAGVARVAKDHTDCGLAPRHPQPVGVACPVLARRRRDVVGGEALGDGQVAAAVQEQAEDPRHDRGGSRVGFQDVQPHAQAGLGRIGMLAGVGEAVAVGGPAAQEAAL